MSEFPQPAGWVRAQLRAGLVIPAHPLALTAERRLDERRQRALTRYYHAAGAGGVAVGVHTTQFEIRDPRHGLFKPVLELAAETVAACDAATGRQTVRIAGLCGPTAQAVAEAEFARHAGYHAGLLSLAALQDADDEGLLAHCRAVARVMPLMGFYLQPAVGGRRLSFRFWRAFVEIPNVVAIKIAPFNRYQTLDVVRAVAEAGRAGEVALYTGNDDNIVADLLTEYAVPTSCGLVRVRMVGGLLGHWAFWTRAAVELHARCRACRSATSVPAELLTLGAQVTDCNAAIFDVANGFAGCLPGIHEVLRRQGLLANTLCLNPHEQLSPGQGEEIERVARAYPHLTDDAFVAEHLEAWLA
ncbi:MAG: dihydrodipicolinate synthase family protein [Verrucomicrobiales bacterium]|nr:dihydrodipicolinate synthase family protein [Verrucomicrobiales bacterium]